MCIRDRYYAGKQFDGLVAEMEQVADSAKPTAKAVDKISAAVKNVAKETKRAKLDVTMAPGGVGAATAGTMGGFSAVHAGRKQLLQMLQQMKEAQRERKKQTAALNEISQNTAEQFTIRQANI